MTSRWIDQTRTRDTHPDVRGDCTRAAVASLFAIPLDAVPDFDADDPVAFYEGVEAFFLSLGFEMLRLDGDVALDALHLANGPAARGVSHSVVRRGTEIVHDPHPSRAGLLSVEMVVVPVPLDPGEVSDPRRDAPRTWRARDKEWAPWNGYLCEADARADGWRFVERVPT